MRSFIYVLLIALTPGCEQAPSYDLSKKDSTQLELYQNASFSASAERKWFEWLKLEEGSNHVFTYKHKGQTFISSQEYEVNYEEHLIFDFDPTQDSLSASGTSLKDLNCTYGFYAWTSQPTYKVLPIEKGTIKGQKLDNDTWKFTIAIATGYTLGGVFNSNERKITLDETLAPIPIQE